MNSGVTQKADFSFENQIDFEDDAKILICHQSQPTKTWLFESIKLEPSRKVFILWNKRNLYCYVTAAFMGSGARVGINLLPIAAEGIYSPQLYL